MKALAIAALVGALLGGVAAWKYQAGRIEAAQSRTEMEAQKRQMAQADLQQCKDASALQNAAIAEMAERARQARERLIEAEQERDAAETLANEIMMERTPAGQDACVAASNAFDAELRRERGK